MCILVPLVSVAVKSIRSNNICRDKPLSRPCPARPGLRRDRDGGTSRDKHRDKITEP